MLVLVYRPLGYMDIVHEVAERLMNLTVRKIKERPDYDQSGEVYNVHVRVYCELMYILAVGHH